MALSYTVINPADGTVVTAPVEINTNETVGAFGDSLINGASSSSIVVYTDEGDGFLGKYFTLSFEYQPPQPTPTTFTFKKSLIAAADHSIYYETNDGIMGLLTPSENDLITTQDTQLVEAYQKAFVVNDNRFRVVDFAAHSFTTTSLGSNNPTPGMVLQGNTSNAQLLVSFVTGNINGVYTLYGQKLTVEDFSDGETVSGSNSSEQTVTFTIADFTAPTTPHYYNWTTFLTDTDTYGTLPERATIGALYRGRMVLSGNPRQPFQWYMSRQGNIFDFNYFALDVQGAVAGGNSDVGELGDVIRALIPYKDDYLVFGCENTVWLLRGDPRIGGTLNEVSLSTGIFSNDSWAYDGLDNLYFIGNAGLYRLAPDMSLENVSLVSLPDFPANWELNRNIHKVLMTYDNLNHGLLITRVTIETGETEAYWFDLRTQGFFPESYHQDCGAFTSFQYNSLAPDYSGLLFGGRDGYIRVFDDAAKNDDTGDQFVPISSYAAIGPIPMSDDPSNVGKLISLSITPAQFSDKLEYKIYMDRTAEGLTDQLADAPNASPRASGTITIDRPQNSRKRSRGNYMGVWVGNEDLDKTWGLEIIVGTLMDSGRY